MRGKRFETRTKVVATVGPASLEPAVLEKLCRLGVDVFRLNMSHGTHEQKRKAIAAIRRLARRQDRAVAVLCDLQGPRIRLGEFEGAEPFYLRRGDTLAITTRQDMLGRPGLVTCNYPGLVEDVRRGERILLDDGNIELKAVEVSGTEVRCRVVYGGLLKQMKGVNLPGSDMKAPALTSRDLKDLQFALEEETDFVALSFVRSAADIQKLRSRLGEGPGRPMVIAKIERKDAVRNLPSILAASDGLMVARGDLGVEVGAAMVPILQKRMIRLAIRAGKPVITATQMLESMVQNPRPTRAEASDVANAIYDGTSAVMLSGETAAGAHPALVVRTMVRLIRITEREIGSHEEALRRRGGGPLSVDHGTVRAAAFATLETGARLVVVFTESGRTARMMAQERVPVRIVAFTPSEAVYRQLALSWGVHPLLLRRVQRSEQLIREGEKAILQRKLAKPGDRIVFIAGVTPVSGATNTMTIRSLKASKA